jgi:hypothetical protein
MLSVAFLETSDLNVKAQEDQTPCALDLVLFFLERALSRRASAR